MNTASDRAGMGFENLPALKALVRTILDSANVFTWTLQGFGMLRLSMNTKEGDFRLNIWDSRYRVADVSLMHTHPWDFDSLILAGSLCNLRFTEAQGDDGEAFDFATIKPGPGGGVVEGESGTKRLICSVREYFSAGDVYRQRAEEIHISLPEDGTITLNRRERRGDDVAQVFWRSGKSWVSAEPYVASSQQVMDIARAALRIL